MNVKTVLNNIQRIKKQKEISSEQMAAKLCVSYKTFRDIEAGFKSMSLDQFFHLAAILGETGNELLIEYPDTGTNLSLTAY